MYRLPTYPRGGIGLHRTEPYQDIDLFNPEQQSFPATLAEVTAAGFAGTPEALWAFQETSGTTLADTSGNGHTLTASDAVRCLTGQRSVGLFDGASFRSQRAIEIVQGLTGSNKFELALSTQLDKNWTTGWSLLGVCRFPQISASGGFISKGVFGAGAHWGLSINASNGTIECRVSDGTNSVVLTTTGNVCDGANHWFYVRWDPISDTLKCDTDLATGFSISTAAITTAANSGRFRIGEYNGLANSSSFQVRGLIVFSDVATTVASIQAWWKHGGAQTGLTYSRASTLHTLVADDSVTGDVVAAWALGRVAHQYNSLVSTNALKLEIAKYIATTNLIPNSDLNNGTSWPVTGTKTLYDADSPRGFREAVKHTKTAINQSILCAAANGASVTLDAIYTASVYYEWDGLVTAPVLQVYRADGTTSIGSVSATDGSGKRRRMTVTFTAPATEAVRIALKGSADASTSGSGRFFGPMINAGSYAMPYIHTNGATASTVATSARVSVPGLTSDFGTVKVWATFAGQDSANYRVLAAAVQTAGSIANERAVGVSVMENLWFGAGSFDFQGSAQADLVAVESVVTAMWDKAERHGWSARANRNGSVITSTTDLAAVTPAEVLYIGSRGDGTIGHDGGISKLRIYRNVELAP